MLENHQLIHHYLVILDSIKQLAQHIHQELATYPAWVNDDGILISDKGKVIATFSHFLPSGATPQQTYACPGALAGNSCTLKLVQQINCAKDQFKQTVNDLLKEQEYKDTSIVRSLLAHAGHPGIKLKQVYRHIRYIDFHPRRISFTRTKHNSHRVISKPEALERLKKAGQGLHIDVQKDQLNNLLDTELVIHRDVQPIWAINVATFKNELGLSQSIKITTSLPLIYRHVENQPIPIVTFSKPYTRHQLEPRCDKQIENDPFLPSISAYRYK